MRFFYNPRQERYDYMYRSVMEAVFPSFRFKRGQKDTWLKRFQDAGYYMIDATDKPVNGLSEAKRRQELCRNVERKLVEIRELTVPHTPILLIKKNIFEIFNEPLRNAGMNVVHETFLPFPAYGYQRRFVEACSKCIRAIES
ncbi:MAG TPA: hypothetical protein VFQ88_00300 [Nevskiaceae bacterium]|nr:hypothetical protein [Nevskiaceae bacterium]